MPDGRRHAAVAAVVLPDDEGRACFLLTRRAATLKTHARQWALPGGLVEAGETPERAALRELHEEVGLALEDDAVLGLLDDYGTRAGFIITPVVVWAGGRVELTPDPAEVALVYRVPLADLDHPDVPIVFSIPQSDRPLIQLPILGNRVNAPTAALIYQMREVVVHGRPTRVDHFEQPVWTWRARMPSVLFVGHAGTARSVMAHALLERMLAERGMADRVRVRSGGVASDVRDGATASVDARLALAEVGLHVSEHAILATDLGAHREVITASDLVLAMTVEQKARVATWEEARDRPLFTLREFAGDEGDIADPAGQGKDGVRLARDEITRCLRVSFDRLVAAVDNRRASP